MIAKKKTWRNPYTHQPCFISVFSFLAIDFGEYKRTLFSLNTHTKRNLVLSVHFKFSFRTFKKNCIQFKKNNNYLTVFLHLISNRIWKKKSQKIINATLFHFHLRHQFTSNDFSFQIAKCLFALLKNITPLRNRIHDTHRFLSCVHYIRAYAIWMYVLFLCVLLPEYPIHHLIHSNHCYWILTEWNERARSICPCMCVCCCCCCKQADWLCTLWMWSFIVGTERMSVYLYFTMRRIQHLLFFPYLGCVLFFSIISPHVRWTTNKQLHIYI